MHNVNLYLRQANENKLVLESGTNLMAKIITEVNSNGVLEIRNENQCNWVRSYDKPINVYLEFKDLDSLENIDRTNLWHQKKDLAPKEAKERNLK